MVSTRREQLPHVSNRFGRRVTLTARTAPRVLPEGFEPSSAARKAAMIGRATPQERIRRGCLRRHDGEVLPGRHGAAVEDQVNVGLVDVLV